MATGVVQGFSINELFEMLSVTGKTGMLDIKADNADCQVFFSGGKIFYATSANARLFLGERLVEEKLVDEAQMVAALEEQKSSGERIGKILVEKKAITNDDLNRFLKDQIIDELYRIIEIPSVQFNFCMFDEKPLNDMGVYLDTKDLVKEAEAKSAEWQRIQLAMPDETTALILNDELDIDEIILSRMEWKVLAKTAKLRTVGQIVASSKEKEFDILKNLLKLLDADVIKKEEFKKAVAPIKTVAGKAGDEADAVSEKEPDDQSGGVGTGSSGKYVKKDKKEIEAIKSAESVRVKGKDGKDVPIEWESYLERMAEEANEAAAKKA